MKKSGKLQKEECKRILNNGNDYSQNVYSFNRNLMRTFHLPSTILAYIYFTK